MEGGVEMLGIIEVVVVLKMMEGRDGVMMLVEMGRGDGVGFRSG